MASLIMDYMEYTDSAAAQAAYVSNGTTSISNADIDDEDMADITDWTDADTGNGVSSQATFDDKSCMKLDGGVVSGMATRTQDIGTFGARTVFSFNLYGEALGTFSDRFYLMMDNGTYLLYASFCTDGLRIVNSAEQHIEIGTDLVVQDTWQEWTFDINWTAKTVDIYLDGILKASSVDCGYVGGATNGFISFNQRSGNTNNRITYIDWFKAGSSTTTNPNFWSLQSYSEVAIKTQGNYSLKGVAAITDSLNKTLTKTLSPVSNLTGVKNLKFDMRAIRTGENIKLGLHNTTPYEVVDQQQNEGTGGWVQGDAGGEERRYAQAFQLSGTKVVTAVEFKWWDIVGSPTGNLTYRIETDNAGIPSGTLANANASIVVTPVSNNILKGTFATPFSLNGSTTYHLVIQCDNQANDTGWTIGLVGGSLYNGGMSQCRAGTWLHNVAGIDLTFKVYVQAFTTTELITNIITADTFQTVNWNLSVVTDANKNAIDQIIITIVNADVANTFYLDYFEIAQAIDIFGIIS